MNHDGQIIIEIHGEGKTETGQISNSHVELPEKGVLPILVHSLCGRPGQMRVKRYNPAFLQKPGCGKGLWQKVRFVRRQASQTMGTGRPHGVVFLRDSEGDLNGILEELKKGRDAGPSTMPMAVGTAHPCIESWLLADAHALKKGLSLRALPTVPDKPEDLPAPKDNREYNPKTVLRDIAGITQQEVSASSKEKIAKAMDNLELVKQRCEKSFKPFAEEVESVIRPLFN